MVKGFIFDLDGVITETASLHYLAWKETVKKFGISYNEKENDKLKGLPRKDTLIQILKNKNLISLFSDEDIENISNEKNALYKKKLDDSLGPKDILPGILHFLQTAKKRQVKLAIASSSFNAPKILQKTGIMKEFNYVVNLKTVKNGKPAPDIFLQAAKGLKLKCDLCVGFEDSTIGLEAIKSAKMKAVVITHKVKADWSKADVVLESTKDLDFEKIISL